MTGGGEDSLLDPVALARAEAALSNLTADYPRWLDSDLTRARESLDEPADFQRFYSIVHDIKGQAGTFGYPLVTSLAQRLCRHIQDGTADKNRLEQGLNLIRQAMDQGLADETSDDARRLLSSLD